MYDDKLKVSSNYGLLTEHKEHSDFHGELWWIDGFIVTPYGYVSIYLQGNTNKSVQ